MGQQCQQQCQSPGQQYQFAPSIIKEKFKGLSFDMPSLTNVAEVKQSITQLREKNAQSLGKSLNVNHNEQKPQEQFIGYVENGLKQGYGQLKTPQGMMYYGYFKDNLPHIKGVLIFSHDHYYIGQFMNGQMHGKGKEVSPYFEFVGQYRNDTRHDGKLTTPQFTYEGHFTSNLFHGHGQIKFKNGQKYVGFFQNNQFNGQGIYYAAENSVLYEGEFKDNLYHGMGKYHWEDGSYYEGQYYKGLKHGEGRYYKDGEEVIDGVWQNGSITSRLRNSLSIESSARYNKSSHSTKIQEAY